MTTPTATAVAVRGADEADEAALRRLLRHCHVPRDWVARAQPQPPAARHARLEMCSQRHATALLAFYAGRTIAFEGRKISFEQDTARPERFVVRIAGLPPNADKGALTVACELLGRIVSVSVAEDRSLAYVEFATEHGRDSALEPGAIRVAGSVLKVTCAPSPDRGVATIEDWPLEPFGEAGAPPPSSFTLDPQSGQYYCTRSLFYFSPVTRLYYSCVRQQFFRWDETSRTYAQVHGPGCGSGANVSSTGLLSPPRELDAVSDAATSRTPAEPVARPTASGVARKSRAEFTQAANQETSPRPGHKERDQPGRSPDVAKPASPSPSPADCSEQTPNRTDRSNSTGAAVCSAPDLTRTSGVIRAATRSEQRGHVSRHTTEDTEGKFATGAKRDEVDSVFEHEPRAASVSGDVVGQTPLPASASAPALSIRVKKRKRTSQPPSASTAPAAVSLDIKDHPPSTLPQFVCLPCRRKFPSREKLDRHLAQSILHATTISTGAFRDRAAERRERFPEDDSMMPPRSKRPLQAAEPLPVDNKGANMLRKLGWQDGDALGRTAESGITRPLDALGIGGKRSNQDRSGIGST